MNEKITETFVRNKLNELGYFDNCVIEEQISKNKTIKSLLSKASKSGKGGNGRPEFIIQPKNYPDTLLVVECKANKNKHISDSLTNYKDYAVDGVIHYSKYLSTKFKTIGIAVSGEEVPKISCYAIIQGKEKLICEDILKLDNMISLLNDDPNAKKSNEAMILTFASNLHNYLRDYAKLSENEKPLLIGGLLIALKDDAFVNSYKSKKTGSTLASLITSTIKEQLQNTKMNESKIKNMIQPFSFIETHPVLSTGDIVGKTEHPLRSIIDQLHDNILPFINTYHDHDILGHFYGEFLSYTAGDKKGLGIVLTPKHIKELMCELVNINKDSILLDTCTGTGGFLITGMDMMVKDAKGDSRKISNIKSKQLIGIEQQPHMFALAVSNMMLRGDGKTNIYSGSCFGLESTIRELKPTVAVINPPYSQKGAGLSELDFIANALDCVVSGGYVAAIVPSSVGIGNSPLKQEILKKHTLVGSLSLPQVFKEVGVCPIILIFKAGIPHDSKVKVWFGNCKDDGFIDTKKGRVDSKGRWEGIKNEWVTAFRNKETKTGEYITHEIKASDEWLAEAYLDTDYSKVTENAVIETIKAYSTFLYLKDEK